MSHAAPIASPRRADEGGGRMVRSRSNWSLVALLSATATASYLCRVNLSVVGVLVMREFALTQVQMGPVFSAFLLTYAAAQVPAGAFADRWGARRVLIVAACWWAVATLLQSTAGAAWLWPASVGPLAVLIAGRLLLGMGEAPTFTAAAQGISRWMPAVSHGRANGFVIAAVGAGSAIAPPLLTWAMLRIGWRGALIVSALPALVMALVWRFLEVPSSAVSSRAKALLHDRAARDRAAAQAAMPVEQVDRAAAQAGMPVEQVDRAAPQAAMPVEQVDRAAAQAAMPVEQVDRAAEQVDRAAPQAAMPVEQGFSPARLPFILLTASYSLQGYVGYIFVFWFYLYLVQERHFDLLRGAFLGSLPWVLTIVSVPLGGFISDSLVKRPGAWRLRLVPMTGLVGAGLFIAIGARTQNAWVAALALAAATGLVMCVEGPFWATMTRLSGGRAGRAGGIMNMGCNVGGLISPALTPWLAARIGWAHALDVAAVLSVAGGLLWLGIRPAPIDHSRLPS